MAEEGFYLTPQIAAELQAMLAWWRRYGRYLNQQVLPQRALSAPDVPSISFRNDSGEAIPAWACMRIDSHVLDDGGSIVVAKKPDGGADHTYMFNGPEEVPYTGGGEEDFGQAQTLAQEIRALHDPGYTPALDDKLGPTSGEWHLVEDGDVDLLRVIGPSGDPDEEDDEEDEEDEPAPPTLVGAMLMGGGGGGEFDCDAGADLPVKTATSSFKFVMLDADNCPCAVAAQACGTGEESP